MSTEQQRQRVSALMDGEVGRFEAAAAVKDLIGSADLSGHWERWHIIARALRHEPNNIAARQTAARVRAALDGRDPVMRKTMPTRVAHWLRRPVAGAVAAGVLVLGLALVLTRPLPPSASPGFAEAAGTAERWQQADPAVRARLDRLLVTHQEQAAVIGRSGVAAYAAVIGYERRP
ncbi:sigma-E factor negative regulatory protein [uncultured Thiohalocapsa sp.]|uniref:sigma-E factor negative regulatory protein n=1 Tax=uncultured Thiohalocapsa sp. TaxID=768990 RepID=UPI0025F41785|nr:sigma-E factor negative regulatory protein [uncultured Thiohalocapsa sp.]